jgi:hypothetical protein
LEVQHLLGKDDVAGRRDRQELGDTLDDADQHRLPDQR